MRRTQLINLARRAGPEYVVEGSGTRVIIRRGSVSVALYDDGSAHRADVRLDLAKRMTIANAADALGLLD